MEGVTTINAAPGRLNRCALKLVPFADALDYRVWINQGDRLRRDVPPATAFARARSSQVDLRLEPTARHAESTDIEKSLTEENRRGFCMADPSKPGQIAQLHGGQPAGDRTAPVWFLVMLQAPRSISRIVFRHGKISEDGGWFDSSRGKPSIEVVRATPPSMEKGSFMAFLSIEDASGRK
jgi:hypothetical protein